MRRWEPPAGWKRVTTLETHAAGEPLRIVTGGIDPIPGKTILEKRRYAREHLDALRRSILFEPRGHADMPLLTKAKPGSLGSCGSPAGWPHCAQT